MSPGLTSYGYEQVTLWVDGEKVSSPTIHQLVMEYHGPEPPSPRHDVINHVDGDKTNNHIDNLEWVTELENRLHAAFMESIDRIGEAKTKARLEKWIEADPG